MKGLQKNISLQSYTTFKIGGHAKYFVKAKNKEQLKEALLWARENKQNFFILGGGSNLIISDNGFDGLVIKLENQEFETKGNQGYFRGIRPLLQDF